MYSYEYIVCYIQRRLLIHGNDDYKTVTRYPLIAPTVKIWNEAFILI